MGARGPKSIDPSPAEIRRGTERIRSGWSERTFRLRSGWTVEAADRMDQWIAPLIHVSDAHSESDDEDYPYWSN